MIKRNIFTFICTILALLYLGFFFGGLASVPFHPDEATQIFMSGDIREMFSKPASLFYSFENSDTPRQHYRLVDSPLTRTVIGKGLIFNQTAWSGTRLGLDRNLGSEHKIGRLSD